MTKISCTFVKCKHNDYGKSGYCLRDEIQMGGQVDPKDTQRKVKPVCAYFEGIEEDGDIGAEGGRGNERN